VTDPLVVFSPLPPAKSGIADYMAELLPALAAERPVTVVCDKLPPSPPRGDWQVVDVAGYEADRQLARCPHIYQIGNNADHVFAYRAFKQRPGILVQHDFNLHYLVEDATLAVGDGAGYRDVLYEEYGDAGAALADLRQAGLFSEAQKLALPLNTHLLRRATGLIVHNRWVYDRLPETVRSSTIVVPHHVSPQAHQYDELSQAEARASLGLPPDVFVVLSLGYITPPKQIQTTLAALGLLKRQGAEFLFVVGGQRNPGFDIDAHVARHGLEQHVLITGYLDEDDFFRHIAAADCLVNLRYPSVGESSGTLTRALALGLPAIVYNFGPFAEIPNDIVIKVPLELVEPVALAAALERLMHEPTERDALGESARQYMRSHHSVQRSAGLYLDLVQSLSHAAA